jgi:hypothetical protein
LCLLHHVSCDHNINAAANSIAPPRADAAAAAPAALLLAGAAGAAAAAAGPEARLSAASKLDVVGSAEVVLMPPLMAGVSAAQAEFSTLSQLAEADKAIVNYHL